MHPSLPHPALHLAVVIAVAVLWAAVVVSGGSSLALAATPAEPNTAAARVFGIRGTATVHRSGAREALQVNEMIQADQSVEVGRHSGLRLLTPSHVLLELGPDARIVLPRGDQDRQRMATTALTWVILERGYLRVVAPADQAVRSIAVVAGHWVALAGAGETFFESSSETLSACRAGGVVQGMDAAGSHPRPPAPVCVQGVADRPPVSMALRGQDWAGVRRHRRLTTRLIPPPQVQVVKAEPALAAGVFSGDQLVVIPRTPTLLPRMQPGVPAAAVDAPRRNNLPGKGPRVPDAKAAQALLETAPSAAGPARPHRELYRLRIPGLKWADVLESLRSAPPDSPRE